MVSASLFHPHPSLPATSFRVEIVFRLSVPDNEGFLQFFDNDEHIFKFLAAVEDSNTDKSKSRRGWISYFHRVLSDSTHLFNPIKSGGKGGFILKLVSAQTNWMKLKVYFIPKFEFFVASNPSQVDPRKVRRVWYEGLPEAS